MRKLIGISFITSALFLAACGGSGDGGGAATLTAPTDLIASATSESTIRLSWTDNSSGETGFAVESAMQSTGPFTQVSVTGANVGTHDHIGCSPNMTYYFRVKAVADASSSAYSAVAAATTPPANTSPPAEPSSLVATATGPTAIQVAWSDNANNETGFKLERATASAGPWTQIATPATNAVAYDDTGLTASTSYWYRVRATNAAGDSAYSAVAAATTPPASTSPPAAPSSLVATATSPTAIQVTWTDNANDETGFKLERATASAGPWTQIATPATNAVGYDDTGLNASTSYWYRVRATNAAGDSAYSSTATATTPAIPSSPPVAPSSLVATATGPTTIHLTWTDNANNETGFKLERSTAAGPWTQIATPATNAVAYDDTGLTASTSYWYRIRATNAAGDSTYSSTATATTPAINPPGLAAPSSLVATATGPTTIHLTWTDNANNETGFKLERATASAGPWTQIATPATNAVAYDDTGLTASTSYWYRIRATHSVGDSVYSNVATVTTPATLAPPSPPSNLAATATSSSSVHLTWTDNANNETGFKLERALCTRLSNGTCLLGAFSQIATPAANVTAYDDASVTNSSTYYFRIRATNSAGDSAYSTNAAVTTPFTLTVEKSGTGSGTVTSSPAGINCGATCSTSYAPATRVILTAAAATGSVFTGWSNCDMLGLDGSCTITTSVTRIVTATFSPQISRTVTLEAQASNACYTNNMDATWASRVIRNAFPIVGTDASENLVTTQIVWYASVVKFDVSSLVGKTIEYANLTLETRTVPVGYYPRNFKIATVKTDWSPTTINWNIMFSSSFEYQDNSDQTFYYPTSSSQVYNVDLKATVQNWANNSWPNNGIQFTSAQYLSPGITSLDSYTFYVPTLTITYH